MSPLNGPYLTSNVSFQEIISNIYRPDTILLHLELPVHLQLISLLSLQMFLVDNRINWSLIICEPKGVSQVLSSLN